MDFCVGGGSSDVRLCGRGAGGGRSRKEGGRAGLLRRWGWGMPKLSRYDFVSRREGFALRMERMKSCVKGERCGDQEDMRGDLRFLTDRTRRPRGLGMKGAVGGDF